MHACILTYITLHYVTLRYVTLHYITLHYIPYIQTDRQAGRQTDRHIYIHISSYFIT